MKNFRLASIFAGVAVLAGCATVNSSNNVAANSDAIINSIITGSNPEAFLNNAVPSSPVDVTELHSNKVASLQPPADVWDRIRRKFAMQDIDNDLVREKEKWYASRPDYIERMVGRSRMYIFHIIEELELRNMPSELALLPFIESAFNPQAVSSAKAAGMWQFMPATGTAFSLRQNILKDDRRDVIASTRAALDYLQKLYNMFGDWHLALAAYNWGEGNVSRAIARNKKAGLGTSYLDLKMPNETRHYVPKLQAIKNIIAAPDNYDAVLPIIENHPFFDTVTITKDIDVEVVAQLADIRLEDFKALNPSHKKPVIFAAGTPKVLLPWNNAAIFNQNIKNATGALASWTIWVAPSNMPTREAANRLNMSEADLRSINNLPAGVIIKSGSTLITRRSQSAAPAVAGHIINNAKIAYAPEVVLRKTTIRARKGDTLASIAARYDLPVATVSRWNNANSKTKLKKGQAIALYLPAKKIVAKSSSRAATKSASKAKVKSKSNTKSIVKSAKNTKAVKSNSKAKVTKSAAKSSKKAVTKTASKSKTKSSAKNSKIAKNAK